MMSAPELPRVGGALWNGQPQSPANRVMRVLQVSWAEWRAHAPKKLRGARLLPTSVSGRRGLGR